MQTCTFADGDGRVLRILSREGKNMILFSV